MRTRILIFSVTILFPALLVATTASTPYDPWADLDDDGDIDIFDIVDIAGRYGTTGNPAKNVNVTNWPTSSDVPVWFSASVPPTLTSSTYYASGFGHLHILLKAVNIFGGDILTFYIYGNIWDVKHTSTWPTVVYAKNLTSTTSRDLCFTIPIPSETFFFVVAPVGGSTGVVSLSYYLTWS